MSTLLLNSPAFTLPAPSLIRKQNALTISLSWLTTATWQKQKPSLSNKSAPRNYIEQNAHYLLSIQANKKSIKQATGTPKLYRAKCSLFAHYLDRARKRSASIRKLTSFSNKASMNQCYPHTVRRRDLTYIRK